MDEKTQLRAMAVDLAVKALRDTPIENGDVVKLAKEIFEFIQGETK
jgi:hypothetical protein